MSSGRVPRLYGIEAKQKSGSRIGFGALVLLVCFGCSNSQPPAEQSKPLAPEVRRLVLDRVPKDVENRGYIDFGGKVQLVGYTLKPDGVAKPGSQVNLTMYWQSSAPLSPGWKLFTHLIDKQGNQLGNLDQVGPLRSGDPLPPSRWQPGKIYVDQQTFEVPRSIPGPDGNPIELKTPELGIAVGVWREGARLNVIGGRSDRTNRALLEYLPTGIQPSKSTPNKEAEEAAAAR